MKSKITILILGVISVLSIKQYQSPLNKIEPPETDDGWHYTIQDTTNVYDISKSYENIYISNSEYESSCI